MDKRHKRGTDLNTWRKSSAPGEKKKPWGEGVKKTDIIAAADNSEGSCISAAKIK
jgi:hypothetical protein